MDEKEKEVKIDEQDEIVEEEHDEEDDNLFLKSLEEIDSQDEDEDENEEDDEEDDEALRIKNKNAEEARKRREAEAKAKLEEEAKAKILEEQKPKEKEDDDGIEEDDGNTQEKNKEPQKQVKELVEKYPDLDLGELDKNEDFQEYLQGKWFKGGKTITEIYEAFISFKSRILNQEKAEVEKQYHKKSTPSIKGSSGGNGGDNKQIDIYSKEEIEILSAKLPFMSAKEYNMIEAKLDRSIKHHKNK